MHILLMTNPIGNWQPSDLNFKEALKVGGISDLPRYVSDKIIIGNKEITHLDNELIDNYKHFVDALIQVGDVEIDEYGNKSRHLLVFDSESQKKWSHLSKFLLN